MLDGWEEVTAPPARAHRHRVWWAAVIAVSAVYAVLTVLIMVGSPLDQLDQFFYHLGIARRSSSAWSSVNDFVQIGDGIPVSVIAALYAIKRSWNTRSWTPWVMFGIALFLLNASVGAVKHLTGRLGPSATDVVHTVWAGGTIFPSGHAANATVMFGLMAVIAPAVHRRVMMRMAITMATLIGIGTVILRTHWVSDVFGGWLAGVLVLLVLAPLTPPVDRLVTRTARRLAPLAFDVSVALLLPPLPRERSGLTRASGPAMAIGSVVAGHAGGSAPRFEALGVRDEWRDGHRHGGGRRRHVSDCGRRAPSGTATGATGRVSMVGASSVQFAGFDTRGPPGGRADAARERDPERSPRPRAA